MSSFKQGTISGLLLAMSALAASATASELSSSTPHAPRVLTLLDYFEDGRRAVDAFVLAQTQHVSPTPEVLARTKRSCVRIEIRSNEDADGYQSIWASGVLIDDGRRVLTAGHAVDDASKARILVKLLDGNVRDARVLGSQYEVFGGANHDWAILEIVGPPVTEYPSTRLGRVRNGTVAFVLGYPDQIGVDPNGKIIFDSDVEGSYLEPIVTLGTVRGRDPLRLVPLAGSVPTGGMSGAPVFDASGRLIGVFVSVGKATSRSNVAYTYNAASVESLRSRVSRPGAGQAMAISAE